MQPILAEADWWLIDSCPTEQTKNISHCCSLSYVHIRPFSLFACSGRWNASGCPQYPQFPTANGGTQGLTIDGIESLHNWRDFAVGNIFLAVSMISPIFPTFPSTLVPFSHGRNHMNYRNCHSKERVLQLETIWCNKTINSHMNQLGQNSSGIEFSMRSCIRMPGMVYSQICAWLNQLRSTHDCSALITLHLHW